MDVLFFLKDRTRFIRKYYERAVLPFEEIMRKIDAEEDPYSPAYSDEGDPLYLGDGIEAAEMQEIMGRCCLSMLSGSLQLYFKTWDHILGLTCDKSFKADFRQGGLIGGYRACLGSTVGIDWQQCPADLAIIEQVVLARNRDQHPEGITSVRVNHSEDDRQRFPRPFFMSEHEAAIFLDREPTPSLFGDGVASTWMMPLSVHVSREKLITAIEQVESLCEWLEEPLLRARYPRRNRSDARD